MEAAATEEKRLLYDDATEIARTLIEAGLDVSVSVTTPGGMVRKDPAVGRVRIEVKISTVKLAGQLKRIAELAERHGLDVLGTLDAIELRGRDEAEEMPF